MIERWLHILHLDNDLLPNLKSRSKAARLTLWGILAAALAILLIAAAIFRINSWEHPFDDQLFDEQRWAQADPQERALMADDLQSYVMALSKSQVIDLIGKPDEALNSNQYTPKPGLPGGDMYSYYIGKWPSAGHGHAFVCLFFDESGKVIEVLILGTP